MASSRPISRWMQYNEMARLARIKAVDKMTSISKADVLSAQKAWGEGIVAISKAHSDGGDFKTRATQHINTLYAYGEADAVSYTHLTLPTILLV